MKTIIERARERALKCNEGYTEKTSYDMGLEDGQFHGYYAGATEQKAIDIHKAIKAHCSFCEAHNACVDRGEFYCPETEHIKKTLEE